KSRDSWIEGSRVSYAKSVDEAIAEAHDPHTLLIANREGFHVTKVEQTEYGKKKPA
ncbi:hypothetical protein I8H89_00385, partial [Candidatus Saccharibacteria bacterium]|nr:hypothetical protein [Candidatus Saccharibacteria bacterium]